VVWPRRDYVVQLAVSSELAAWLAERIAAYHEESPPELRWLGEYVAQAGALPLCPGWSETIGLRPDGEIVSWSTEGEYPGTKPVEDRYLWLTSLVSAAKRHPQLRALLPVRPPGAWDCPHLANPIFAEDKVFCPECCALGWVECAAFDPDTVADKDPAILAVVERLGSWLGSGAFIVVDHWKLDACAIGIASPRNHGVLVYIFCRGEPPDRYGYELELPPQRGDDCPYEIAGAGRGLSFEELAGVVAGHLKRAESEVAAD
jgi:hypothetical protein